MIPTAMTQQLALEHRKDLRRTADRWRTVRAAVLARRAALAAARRRGSAPVTIPLASAPIDVRSVEPAHARR